MRHQGHQGYKKAQQLKFSNKYEELLIYPCFLNSQTTLRRWIFACRKPVPFNNREQGYCAVEVDCFWLVVAEGHCMCERREQWMSRFSASDTVFEWKFHLKGQEFHTYASERGFMFVLLQLQQTCIRFIYVYIYCQWILQQWRWKFHSHKSFLSMQLIYCHFFVSVRFLRLTVGCLQVV